MSRRRGTQHRRPREPRRAGGVIAGEQLHILLVKYTEDDAEEIGLGGVFSTAHKAEEAAGHAHMFDGYKIVTAPLNMILFAYASEVTMEPAS